MIWLGLTWLALIALWGASEAWDVGGHVRRLVQMARVGLDHDSSTGVEVGDR